jgi:hypothetical protein
MRKRIVIVVASAAEAGLALIPGIATGTIPNSRSSRRCGRLTRGATRRRTIRSRGKKAA